MTTLAIVQGITVQVLYASDQGEEEEVVAVLRKSNRPDPIQRAWAAVEARRG